MNNILPYLKLFQDIARYYPAKHRSEDLVILEIGISKGYSTRYFLRGLVDRNKSGFGGKLYSIDIKNSPRFERYVRKNKEMSDCWIEIIGDSKLVEWDKSIDVLFIDGDHSYDYVKSDFERFSPYVREGGLILMHDISIKSFGVCKYWEEISYPKVDLILNRAGLGIVRKTQ